jgi:dipeptidyl aminopeptidase/acylaminoacyl peptidase
MRITRFLFSILISLTLSLQAQENVMTPELLWDLGRVGAECISPDGNYVYYRVTYFDKDSNSSATDLYRTSLLSGKDEKVLALSGTEHHLIELPDGKMGFSLNGQLWSAGWDGSEPQQISAEAGGCAVPLVSPDGNLLLYASKVKTGMTTTEKHPDLEMANARVIDDLMFRHWDEWSDAYNQHLFVGQLKDGVITSTVDIMKDEPYDCPTMPFGGAEDFIWNGDGTEVYYVSKKKTGAAYAVSTNTDIYTYSVKEGSTRNLTSGMMGYDTHPVLSPDGKYLAFLSMERDGYEADKNRIMVMDLGSGEVTDLSGFIDETVYGIMWSADGKKIWFTSPEKGRKILQVFDYDSYSRGLRIYPIRTVAEGIFDITGMIGETDGKLLVTRTDMNTATEIYRVDTQSGKMEQITHVNDKAYSTIEKSRIREEWIPTSDGKEMLVWVILPPGFDEDSVYPTLLYCQGGPQGALSQFYSFRWNFQLMAAQGYVVIAPNRRGMPGHGTAWNEQISGDWGGQAIQDYLTATDWARTLPFVDGDRFAAVGASYGGYSVFMLAGVHEGRFKSFIAHDGIYNTESFYGTTEEMWFADWDMGGAYWEGENKSYTAFNPMNHVQYWDTPILIFQGGRDFRTTEDQSFQAFTAARLRGIKSRMVYFPEENHWVLSCQNGLLWQREFYGWLDETLGASK